MTDLVQKYLAVLDEYYDFEDRYTLVGILTALVNEATGNVPTVKNADPAWLTRAVDAESDTGFGTYLVVWDTNGTTTRNASCSCPDFYHRSNGPGTYACKHIRRTVTV